MNAKEARNLSDVNNIESDPEYISIQNKIKSAAQRGYYKVKMQESVKNLIVEKLRSLGYEVTFNGPPGPIITW